MQEKITYLFVMKKIKCYYMKYTNKIKDLKMKKDKRHSLKTVKKDTQVYIDKEAKLKLDKIVAYGKKTSENKVYSNDVLSRMIDAYYDKFIEENKL
jgi:hypothetical protein